MYIPLPDSQSRKLIIESLLKNQPSSIDAQELLEIVDKTDGYSGSDMDGLVREASLGPIRDIDFDQIETIDASNVRPIKYSDFVNALTQVRASVSEKDLKLYLEFDKV